MTWKRPYKSRLLLLFFLVSGILFSVIPARFQVKWFFFMCGFEFFVLMPLRSHYPRYRRLFSIIEWFLWDVPNDSEFAMEIIRKRHRSAELDSDEVAHHLAVASMFSDRKFEDSDVESIDADSFTSANPAGAGTSIAGAQASLHVPDTRVVDGAGNPIPLGPSNGVVYSESTGGTHQDSSDDNHIPPSVSKVTLMSKLTKVTSTTSETQTSKLQFPAAYVDMIGDRF